MPTVNDLLSPASADDLFADALAVAQGEGLPTTAWQAGSVPRTLLKADAAALADLHTTQAAIAKGAFLDDAVGAWLTLHAAGRFQVTRAAATLAEGVVVVSCSASAGPHNISAAGLLVSDGTRRWRSTNTSTVTVASGGTQNITVRAESPGTGYNASNDTITTLVSPALAGLTVNNPAYASGTWLTSPGAAEETDGDLRARCRARWSTLGRGANSAAYRYWATTCPDAATITRATVVPGAGDGTLTVYIAQATAVPAGGQVAAVQAWVDTQKPVTDTATVTAATAVTVQVNGSVRFASSTYDTSAARSAIEAAVAAYITAAGGGDTIDLGGIYHAVFAATAGVADVDLSLPTGDTVLTSSQIGAASVTLTYSV